MQQILRSIVLVGIFSIPFITLLVTNNSFFPYITGKNFAFRVIVEVIFAAWVLLALYDKAYRPRFSWIVATFASLLAVMLFANAFGEHPATSFWSNFERMEGYVTLVHVFMLVVVAGSTLKSVGQWQALMITSIVVATGIAMHGLSQLSATYTRVDSTLGNAAYMAVYMLFHIFMVVYLAVRQKTVPAWIVASALIALFTFVLLVTGTRGTAIGLAAGAGVGVAYVALFGAKQPQVRRYAVGAMAALVFGVGLFYTVKDTDYVQNTPSLARVANIDLEKDLAIRSIIWGMAMEGIKERPVLGWGQGNFNYIFNEQYDPRLYAQEQWFDRVHNLVLDWLVAGGILGLLAYSSIFVALGYYLLYRPFWRDDSTFTLGERAVLVALIAGYITHNLVVFDNIVSYIFFGVILAYIHSRVARPVPQVEAVSVSPLVITNIYAPVAAVALGVVLVWGTYPHYAAARDIIDALRTTNLSERYEIFDRALTRGSFGQQEIVEQFVQQTISIGQSPDVSEDIKNRFTERAEAELADMLVRKPGDTRLYVFLANYYRATGQHQLAADALVDARALSPQKQSIIMQQAASALALNQTAEAEAFFKEAFELDERNTDARQYYAAMLFSTGQNETGRALLADLDDRALNSMAQNAFVLNSLYQAKEYPLVISLYERKTAQPGATAQDWASLAFIQHESGDGAAAIASLTTAKTKFPNFANGANCIISNIETGKDPQTPCS